MRYRLLTTVTLALGVVLLVDVLRVFLPAVITIFGQAASTPAELLGAFAFGWFLLALAAPALIRRVGARPVTLVAAVLLVVARLAVNGQPGGRLQLWLATAGLLAGLVWLAGVAAGTDRPVPGLALGLAVGAVLHTVLDTYRSAFFGDWPAWLAAVGVAGLFLAGQARPAPPAGAGGVRSWLLAGPALLLAGMVALSPAVARTATSYQFGLLRSDPADEVGVATVPLFGPAPLAVAVGGFLLAALAPPRRGAWRWLGPVALVGGTVLVALGRGELLLPAVLLTAVGLGACLASAGAADGRGDDGADEARTPVPGGAGQDPARAAGGASAPARAAGGGQDPARAAGRRGYAAVAGMLVFAVAAVAYYSAYDLGHPNAGVPVAVAALVAAVALARRPAPGPRSPLPPVWTAATAAVMTLLAAVASDELLSATNRDGPPETVRVAAYNVRMGFGMDGRFDPDALARAVAGADVVALSEVDRGWLLNGGHDTLDLLAERLDMPYVFAPAADPLWGDAVLSRWPLDAARTRPLPAVGAPTGAQALGVTVDFSEGVRLAVVATHLQPPPGEDPVVQARAVADFAVRYAAGRPLVVAGDLNTEPGDPAFAEFTRAGLVDALAAARPLPTSPADAPRQQIDHVFVTPGLAAADAAAPPGTASDHLPVAVTLTLPPV
ncbi:endonuclease/exonuclease/phosphatase family protein [Micromonospora sp. DSM 115977]|uniref:Endonuclease/exonuclease/phosphatase family protein n=1 Tax=Micromonospora reichwaldensis TaxID=3075516 RepID=A0ABU2WT74_9ACTN|nr:endonuclease/exonuclease/phosphatase family protein [Micromonospora sp. DSM 115977]MDT0528789.1 endonuclease/exonuclease/phosphatase family protein [Micromonospora sp. DSM 115977]